MPSIKLSPRSELLSQEHVLVQAWKKAHDYIRRHNWYADVLELDLTNARLQERLQTVSGELQSDNPLRSERLRLVLAPKSLPWDVEKGRWAPVDGPKAAQAKLRPLAHVGVRDQIIATAFMLVLADTVETRQGDPRGSVAELRRRKMMSYGHRLLCDEEDGRLVYRWGNAITYRQYFEDYQAFVARPQQVVNTEMAESTQWAIVYADLSQFYDRVRPDALFQKLASHLGPSADVSLLNKFRTFFDWKWHQDDQADIQKYSRSVKPAIEQFDRVALPQGLVVSGFFSNVFLLDFDEAIWRGLNEWHDGDAWQMVDYCRYVDDMRFVVRLGAGLAGASEKDISSRVCRYLGRLLADHAGGLILNPDKCQVILGREAAAGSIPVSVTMKRINQNASGVIDLMVGEETIDLIEGLFNLREEPALDFEDRFRDTFLAAKPDIRDETVARFAANRFRRTFRSLRPLCPDAPEKSDESLLPAISHKSLDNKAIHFCRRLIERWVRDPANMRLLRVALDVYPDEKALALLLHVLTQYVKVGGKRAAPRRVACYCAAELLKAGATETGLVSDADCLPAGIDLSSYQRMLGEFAEQIVAGGAAFPWYLQQQALLFLACTRQYVYRQRTGFTNAHLRDYVRLHRVLAGKTAGIRKEDLVPFVLLQEQFQDAGAAAKSFLAIFRKLDTPSQRSALLRILQENARLADAIRTAMTLEERVTWNHLYHAHGAIIADEFPRAVEKLPSEPKAYPLLSVATSPINPFQQEYAVLHFALALLDKLAGHGTTLFPARIKIHSRDWRSLWSDQFPIEPGTVTVEMEGGTEDDVRFRIPPWVLPQEAWKYRLGQILRVLLTGQGDFTATAQAPRKVSSLSRYTPYRSSWLRRCYGLFNGRNAFGPPWLPISTWLGSLLSRLLEWPGFSRVDREFSLADDFDAPALGLLIRSRIVELENRYGKASRTPLLPLRTPKAFGRRRIVPDNLFKMRIGVVQTVIPRLNTLRADPELSNPATRTWHRRHLAAVLGGVHRMLQVRETHCEESGIDLLVLPELSVHRADVRTHLVPFALQHHCMVFAGIVFQPVLPGSPRLVNIAQWIIPVRDSRGGLHPEYVEQGKCHLTAVERELDILSFRPNQWLLDFVHPITGERLWTMSGAVCYDSTDLCLAADLRDQSDMFIVPALNFDIGTFDNMASALHYHMYQHMIVANTGEYGGSTGQAPFDDRHRRVIFHTHGNEQSLVSFFEVDLSTYRGGEALKEPPAGYRPRT